jgi:hypothetical protein
VGVAPQPLRRSKSARRTPSPSEPTARESALLSMSRAKPVLSLSRRSRGKVEGPTRDASPKPRFARRKPAGATAPPDMSESRTRPASLRQVPTGPTSRIQFVTAPRPRRKSPSVTTKRESPNPASPCPTRRPTRRGRLKPWRRWKRSGARERRLKRRGGKPGPAETKRGRASPRWTSASRLSPRRRSAWRRPGTGSSTRSRTISTRRSRKPVLSAVEGRSRSRPSRRKRTSSGPRSWACGSMAGGPNTYTGSWGAEADQLPSVGRLLLLTLAPWSTPDRANSDAG